MEDCKHRLTSVNDWCRLLASHHAAVAILFTCEVDNIAYNMGLGEKERGHVEAGGRVDLTTIEASTLAKAKAAHIGLVPLFLMLVVRLVPVLLYVPALGFVGMMCVPATFVVPGILEAVWARRIPVGTKANQCRTACARTVVVVANWFLGFTCMMVCFFVALGGHSE
jgi:hypothetical protein